MNFIFSSNDSDTLCEKYFEKYVSNLRSVYFIFELSKTHMFVRTNLNTCIKVREIILNYFISNLNSN